MHRDVRRLGVLRAAHKRTLFATIPNYVADSLQKSCSSDVSIIDKELRDIQQSKNNISTNAQLNLVSTTVSTLIKFVFKFVFIHLLLMLHIFVVIYF